MSPVLVSTHRRDYPQGGPRKQTACPKSRTTSAVTGEWRPLQFAPEKRSGAGKNTTQQRLHLSYPAGNPHPHRRYCSGRLSGGTPLASLHPSLRGAAPCRRGQEERQNGKRHPELRSELDHRHHHRTGGGVVVGTVADHPHPALRRLHRLRNAARVGSSGTPASNSESRFRTTKRAPCQITALPRSIAAGAICCVPLDARHALDPCAAAHLRALS